MPPDTGRAAGMDTNPGGEERRRFERHNIYLPVVASGKDRRGERVTESTFTVNVSPGGALLICQNAYPPGNVLDIYFRQWTSVETIHHIRARVVRETTITLRHADDISKGVGVAFKRTAAFL